MMDVGNDAIPPDEVEALRAENARLRAALDARDAGAPREAGLRSTPATRGVLFSAVEKTRMPMILTDPNLPDDPIIFANRAFQEMCGYSSEELVGRNCRFLQGAKTDPAHVQQIRDALGAKRDVALDIVNHRRDGTPFLNELYVSPVFGEDGHVLYNFGSQVEVTRFREHRREVEASEERQRAVFDSMVDVAVVATDPDGVVTQWNTGAERVLGWPLATMRGETIERIFTPEDRAIGRPGEGMREALADGRASDERWHMRASGERFWASGELMPLRDPDGAHIGFVKVLRDRTAEHLAGQALREAEAQLKRAQEVGNVGLFTLDIADDLISPTPEFCRLYGLPVKARFPASLVEARICPEDRHLASTAASRNRSDVRREVEYRVREPGMDGVRWIARTGEVEVDGAGRPLRFVGTVRDVTARRRAEEQLRQSQKMEAVGQLTGGVAHDFNNLLTVIKSSTDLLKRPTLSEERRIRYVGAISDTVDRAAKLTAQLLAFARRQALKPEVFAACDSVRALSEMMSTLTGSRVTIATELPGDTCFVNADPSQFDTALVNMAVNARDAMDGEGRLTIRVEPVEAMPAVRSHPAVPRPFVAVSIGDTGCGIPETQLPQIFEPFFTTKGVGQGTGLGLSQVFGFAKQSGGEVMVASQVGHGTTFTLYLPRVQAERRTPEPEEPQVPVDGHGTAVLVVEDNVDVGTFAVRMLKDLGYVTVLATNASEALAELETDADRFDVVFSDVVMPGMNGIDLAHEIRRRHHDLPVLLASGYSHVLARDGTDGFELLHKPYSVEQLSRLLRKVATGRRRGSVPAG